MLNKFTPSMTSNPNSAHANFRLAFVLLFVVLCIAGCANQATDLGIDDLPEYSGSPSVEVNGNQPLFTDEDLTLDSFETYSALDSLGRCGPAYALIGPETMPTEKRGSIGMVKPSGWQTSKYEWIDGSYLFNRCHLIAYSLAGENDNPLNLITGTRTMNVRGMLPYEERVASYVSRTGNHVLYRVTPLFEGANLVASGVLMEAKSVEDHGQGVTFCVWCYNVEPGVGIDYATGDNWADDLGDAAGIDEEAAAETYVLNTNTHRFHYPACPSVADMKEKNKREFVGTRAEVLEMGYQPCGVCKP